MTENLVKASAQKYKTDPNRKLIFIRALELKCLRANFEFTEFQQQWPAPLSFRYSPNPLVAQKMFNMHWNSPQISFYFSGKLCSSHSLGIVYHWPEYIQGTSGTRIKQKPPCIDAELTIQTRTISSVQFSRSVVSDSLRPHESQHTRPPCPSPAPGVHSDSHPSSPWCHPAISSLVVPFSCPQSLPASKSFPMSQLFTWGGQSTILCDYYQQQ